jgi:hypothetical protein
MRKYSGAARLTALALSFVLVTQPLAFAAPPASPAAANEEEKAFDRLVQDFESTCALLEDALPEIPRDTFAPEAIAEQAQGEPTRLFRWVRDNTWLAPYRGLLRSDAGVLMDRLGNSLDRAMLLHRLLELAGQEIRLARGSLSDEELRTLVLGRRPLTSGAFPEARENALMDETVSGAERLAREHGLDVPGLRGDLEEQAKMALILRDEARRRTASQTDALMALLGDIPEKAGENDSLKIRNEAYRDHWWVQWKKDGHWVDLDPSLSGARPARPLTRALETMTAQELPESLKHRVEIRVIAEALEKGAVRETVLLERVFDSAEAAGKRIMLMHAPADWPADMHPLGGKLTPEKFRKALLEQREWIPVLLVGDRAYVQRGIAADGTVNESPSLGQAKPGEGIRSKVGGFSSMLDAIGGTPEPSPPSAARGAVFSALWIEYVVAVPGRSEERIRRALFDLIGPAARHAGTFPVRPAVTEAARLHRAEALCTATDISIFSARPSEAFVLHSFATSFLARRDLLRTVAGSAGSKEFGARLQEFGRSVAFPAVSPCSWLALLRNSWGREGSGVYMDLPLVLSHHSGIRFGSPSENVAFEAFDIVSNRAAVSPDGGAESFRARLEQGVLDTNAEAMLLRDVLTFPDSGENTARAFERSLRRGVPWVLISAPGDPLLKKFPASVRARLYADLAAGNLVAVPRPQEAIEAGDFAWWRIDPLTGDTLGIGPRGWGSEFIEYLAVTAMPFVAVGSFFGCMGGPEGWDSASSMKILGCAYCAWISSSSIALAMILTGGAAAATGLASSAISGGMCGFFGAFAK